MALSTKNGKESSMEEEPQNLVSESIPIDAPEPEICSLEADLELGRGPTEFPVKRVETVCGFQAGHKIVRVDSTDPMNKQAIHMLLKLV
jgi:hypothetical protein